MNIEEKYKQAKNDIKECWENPLKKDDRIRRTWIYSVDPETMAFVKDIYGMIKGYSSLYSTFVKIRRSNSLDELLYN